MRYPAICLALLIMATAPCLGASFPVLDGSDQAVIVHQRDARAQAVQAYRELAQYLEMSTGRTFVVKNERDFDAATDRLPIHVGMTREARRALGREIRHLDRDAYMVVVEEDRVMLAGPTPWATFWAVCQFLEDYVGVRWLIPGPLGIDVPQHQSITAPVEKRVFSPTILSRLWSGVQYDQGWSLRQRIHARYHFHHNLLNIFPRELFDEDPDLFPMHGDKRYKPGEVDHAWQPCMTNPRGIQRSADAARKAFAENPDLESYSYGINDGQGYCECPDCKAVSRPVEPWHGFSGEQSYLYYSWLNQVAENLEADYPDKMLGCLAYSAVILPPPGLKLHRNIIPYFTSNRADYFDPKFRGQDLHLLRWWSRNAEQMGIYDYAYGVGFAVPRIYNHLFQDAVKFAVAHNVRGFYAEVYPNWGLDGHKLYVMSRIVWDPNVDVDRLTDEWNERMFREAAEPMKKYWALAEKTWAAQEGSGHWAYRLAADPAQFQIFTPEAMRQMTAYLDQAEALAREDIVKQRIAFFRKTWELTLLLGENYWAGAEVQKLIEKEAPMEEVAQAMREMTDKLAHVDVDAWFKERFADDPIAYYPPLAGWFEPLKAGAMTNATRYFASAVANDAVKMAREAGRLDGDTIRANIDRRCDEIFGEGGSENYQITVARMRDMAMKVGTALRTDAPITVDGVLDEPIWQRADVLTDFIIWGETAPSEYVTKIRLTHDGTDLYVGMECLQDTSDLVTQSAPRDGSTWKDDSIEIFINKGMEAAPHAQFILNAAGAFFDQYDQDGTQSYSERLKYDFNADWAAKIYPDKWTGEVRIPLRELGIDPATQKLVRMNFVRNVQHPQTAISAWFSSLRAHADPLSRGWIVME